MATTSGNEARPESPQPDAHAGGDAGTLVLPPRREVPCVAAVLVRRVRRRLEHQQGIRVGDDTTYHVRHAARRVRNVTTLLQYHHFRLRHPSPDLAGRSHPGGIPAYNHQPIGAI